MIGHGRRWKQAHEPNHILIRVRRAICKLCGKCSTVLPAWSLPHTRYGLETRRQSCESYLNGTPLGEAAPVLQDPDCSPDESTLRRWFRRRIEAARLWLDWAQSLKIPIWLCVPTVIAWDFRAALRILIPETKRDAKAGNGP